MFQKESLKLKCFRLINLYGVVSSFISAILDFQYPVTMSLDIISLAGSLIALKMTRDWRLEEVPQKKRISRFRLNAFGFLFHTIGLILSSVSFAETKSTLVLLVFVYHFVMAAFAILLMLYNIGQILFFKVFGETPSSKNNSSVAEQTEVKNEIIVHASDIELIHVNNKKELTVVVNEVINTLSETDIEESQRHINGDSTSIITEVDDSAIALHNVKEEENNDCEKL